MAKEMIAMLLAGGQGSRLYALTQKLAKPAVPFGGKYRIIDFPLSNCINSGIDTVGILTQYQPLVLNEYIGNGQPWDLDRLYGGVHVLPPYQKASGSDWYKGTANAIYQISDGVIVDIGGGTTGLALLKDGKVVEIADEPTGGTHLTLVLSGNYHIPFAEAEAIKQDYSRHREILPILKPVIEKMATIVKKNIVSKNVDTIYLCGGTCCLTGMEKIIEKETGIPTIKPADPFLVTPTGIAMNCKV